MKCHQCERPAVYDFGERDGEHLRLCVECSHKLQSVLDSQATIRDREWLKNVAMLNHALDEMDFMLPVSQPMRRIPISEIARAMSKQTTLNNIHITNSTGVVLNTGHLAKIDAFVTVTGGTEVEPIGQQIAALTEAIANSTDLANTKREELIELVQGLSQEIVGERKQSVMKAMLKTIEQEAEGAAAVVTLAQGLWPLLATAFGWSG